MFTPTDEDVVVALPWWLSSSSQENEYTGSKHCFWEGIGKGLEVCVMADVYHKRTNLDPSIYVNILVYWCLSCLVYFAMHMKYTL